MKKILLSILVLILYINSNAQSPLRINKFLIDSLAGNGFWYLYHDSTHTGQWGIVAGSGGGGGAGTVTSVAQSFTGGLISVAGSPITTSGTLALTVAGTSGGIPYFSSTSAWASSSLLAANAIMIGGGAGAAPSTTTTGTGVLTALGINVGSAGAFVTFNGAGGTPSAITLTNGTGLPDGGLSLTDVTTNNTSTSAHGFFPKLTANTVYYVSNAGALTALALGASGTVLTSNGATSAPTFTTPAGGGDVSKVGTPVNNQVGVWTGDGTLEGDANLTFASSTLNIGVSGAATGILTLSGVTSGTVTLQPASAAGTYTLTLPTSDGGANEFLQTDGNGVLTWAAGGGSSTWNGITDPTGAQALTFQAGENSVWTDQNTTADNLTINSSTGTTNSLISLNRTGTALASGNNIMEMLSSGANGTSTITATGLRIAVSNTGTSSTNIGISTSATGATNNYALVVRNSANTGNFTTLYGNGEALFTNDVTATLQDPDGFDNTHQIYGGNNSRLLVSSGSSYSNRIVNVAGDLGAVYTNYINGGGVIVETNQALNLGTNKTVKAVITSDGRLYGTALHNNAGAVTGTTTQYIASGTYTATLTNVTNVAASTAFVAQWTRVGNVVTVSGKFELDATAAAATELGISLPIASLLTAEEQLGGVAASEVATTPPGRITADATNDRAKVIFTATSISNDSYSFTFTYLIL